MLFFFCPCFFLILFMYSYRKKIPTISKGRHKYKAFCINVESSVNHNNMATRIYNIVKATKQYHLYIGLKTSSASGISGIFHFILYPFSIYQYCLKMILDSSALHEASTFVYFSKWQSIFCSQFISKFIFCRPMNILVTDFPYLFR